MGLFCSYRVEPTDHEIKLHPAWEPSRIWIVIKRPVFSADTFALVAFTENYDQIRVCDPGYWIDETLVDDERVRFIKRGQVDFKLAKKLRELINEASAGGTWRPIARIAEVRVLPAVTDDDHSTNGYEPDGQKLGEIRVLPISDEDRAKLSIAK
jgi:hypothetical protein